MATISRSLMTVRIAEAILMATIVAIITRINYSLIPLCCLSEGIMTRERKKNETKRTIKRITSINILIMNTSGLTFTKRKKKKKKTDMLGLIFLSLHDVIIRVFVERPDCLAC